MPKLDELSPNIISLLKDNDFKPIKLLRYGPRYICVMVDASGQVGLFKMALPESERKADHIPKGYVLTDHDSVAELNKRILKEARFLEFFTTKLGASNFEPRVIAYSKKDPVWSLRVYLNEDTMSAWDSDFILSQRFYDTITPRQAIDFFHTLHRLSDELSQDLADLIQNYVSTLTAKHRFVRTANQARRIERYRDRADQILERFQSLAPRYSDYKKVITQYEPYAPHIFLVNGHMSLIDWENIGWGHPLQDLSVLWMRCFERPEWQAEYIRLLEGYGYFEGNGRLFWDSELLIQGLANYDYFSKEPIGTPDYDRRAMSFFSDTIDHILDNSTDLKLTGNHA